MSFPDTHLPCVQAAENSAPVAEGAAGCREFGLVPRTVCRLARAAGCRGVCSVSV